MTSTMAPNSRAAWGVCLTMKISEERLREPGLVVIDITAADETTATHAATVFGEL
ncbi:DUF6207 family protein [Streptomyces angustmyceticus]|uniref:DUF6207 family protein n=1 Tax=Streptomyces angustmyceticus TaxID=285578 RepID=UPI003806E827